MGIDSALFVNSPIFWEMMGYRNYLPGVVTNDLRFGHIWRKLNRKRMLPTFASNLFLQIKRPECLKRYNSKIGMGFPYYRFTIKQHQQTALAKLASKLNHRGLVLYAAPAFHTHDELYRATNNKQLVERSNFAPIDRLSGHDTWNYKYPGSSGIAHSEPERIEGPNFQELLSQLELMSNEFDNRRRNTIEEDLGFIAGAMRSATQETSNSNPISREYLSRATEVGEKENEMIRISKMFLNILIFCGLFGIHWHVVSSERSNYF
jgi:hypothetical protein